MRSILITIIIVISQCIQITNKKVAYDGEKYWSHMNCVLTKKCSRMYFYSIEIMSSNYIDYAYKTYHTVCIIFLYPSTYSTETFLKA